MIEPRPASEAESFPIQLFSGKRDHVSFSVYRVPALLKSRACVRAASVVPHVARCPSHIDTEQMYLKFATHRIEYILIFLLKNLRSLDSGKLDIIAGPGGRLNLDRRV